MPTWSSTSVCLWPCHVAAAMVSAVTPDLRLPWKLASKPYPDIRGVANAYRLCCMDAPKAQESSPLSLWDLHYLRELDDTGFIDRLYAS